MSTARNGSIKSTPTFAEIKVILQTPTKLSSRSKAATQAIVNYGMARMDFLDRATPERWASLLAASRTLHRAWLKQMEG